MWSIGLLSNTLKLTPTCAEALFAATQQTEDIWDDPESVCDEDGLITFCADHMEHMDFLDNPVILAVLAEHRVNGEVTFGSLEGDNAGSFWGYRFCHGVLTRLTGEVVFTEESAHD